MIKIHKTGAPIRPIINWTQAPAYKIAKKLFKLINNLTPHPYTFNVQNSIQLMEDLNNIPFNNGLKLVSFDISNMYTKIPTQQLPDITTYLCKQNYVDHPTQREILNLCDTIIKQNYFECQDTFYSQTQGLAMGAPTSSVLSEIFLQYTEHTEICDSLKQHIIGYFRYVDDILIVYNDKDTNIQNILNLFNNISLILNFAIEHEVNNSINFLNLTIYKNQQFSFRVYRKPTATDIIIPHDSTL